MIGIAIICIAMVQSNVITTLFIPHSHDDPGWLEPFETYYVDKVREILNNVVTCLIKYPEFKFVWSETSFLHRWWTETTELNRKLFKQLLAEERIEIVGGGWVMHDEATPDFRDMIEQMDLGLTFIMDKFQIQPQTAWQIDPFGHGSTTASIMAKFGFTSIMLNRISTVEKQMLWNKNCDFYWAGNPTGSDEHPHLFTHILYDHYSQLGVFVYDVFCFSNISKCVPNFFDTYISKVAESTNTPVVPLLYGDDFTYSQTFTFGNAIRLFQALSSSNYSIEKGVNLICKFATYKEYIDSVAAYDLSYGVYRGDFFPFVESRPEHADHWTGYFTTRPCLKKLIFDLMRLVRVNHILFLLSKSIIITNNNAQYSITPIEMSEMQSKFIEASRNSSILLHHDAITGTHTRKTFNDYMNIISNAFKPLKEIEETLIKFILHTPSEYVESSNFVHSNIILHHYVIYNSAAIYRKMLVKFNVTAANIIVTNYNYAIIEDCQINIATNDTHLLICEIGLEAFSAEHILIEVMESQAECNGRCVSRAESTEYNNINSTANIILENDVYTVSMNPFSNFINWIYDKGKNRLISITETMINFDPQSTRSGHYIFNPLKNRTMNKNSVNSTLYNGKLCWYLCVTQQLSITAVLNIKFILQKGRSRLIFADYDYISDETGEILMQLNITGLNENSTDFYTSDSMNYVKRKYRSFEDAVKYKYENRKQNRMENIGLNTFPSVDGFMLKEDVNGNQFYCSFSHSHTYGVALLNSTDIGVLLSRSIMNLDHKGIEEKLDDFLPSSFHTAIFTTDSFEEFMDLKTVAYHTLHNEFEVIVDNSSATTKFSMFGNDFPKEVELISSKIMEETRGSMKVILRVRNSYGYKVNLRISNLLRGVNARYLGKYSMSGYQSEEEVKAKMVDLKLKIRMNPLNKVLDGLRDDFTLLEEEESKKIAKTSNELGNIELAEFELTSLMFSISN